MYQTSGVNLKKLLSKAELEITPTITVSITIIISDLMYNQIVSSLSFRKIKKVFKSKN